MSMKNLVDKKIKRETSKDDIIAKKPDEKLKKSIYSVSTPRNFIPKSSAADIYARKGSAQSIKAPKKTSVTIKPSNNESPMKDLLKSSPSSVSQISSKSNRLNKFTNDSKTPSSARYVERPNNVIASSRNMGVAKKLPFTNVTVNSPISKKKLNADNENVKIIHRDSVKANEKKITKEVVKRKEIINSKAALPERKRTKTRTLEEEEIKILTPDVVDNNLEMLNWSKKLSAQPKAFYVELNEENPKPKLISDDKADEEISYEDDFESYESDFDSYQSDHTNSSDDRDCLSNDVDHDCRSNDYIDSNDNNLQESDEVRSKEERMLDSGNFELPDLRSMGKSKPLDYILEDAQENDKKISLTDEGFQEMSSSSGLSSMRTVHVDILDRPLFIDFTKSKENRRKKKIFERLKQRAEDILSMVTLHEMAYDLFEMTPIPYDLYMATFGRFNYTQTAVQTFDDGIAEEVQTDEIFVKYKWTQNPIEFSNCYFNQENSISKKNSVDNFAFLINNVEDNTTHMIDATYKTNPLRIYLEQKDGVGTNEILSYETYKSKLKNDKYDVKKLRKFLKKFESRMRNVLNTNSGNTMSNLNKSSKFPFSNEYVLITTRNVEDDKISFFTNSQIIAAIFSDTSTNFIITVHSKSSNGFKKCVLCLWDLSVVVLKPLKLLIATDDVKIGKFRGSSDGFLIGALCDGTILLWDLTEQPNWCNDVANEEKKSKMVVTESNINSEAGSDCCDNFKQQLLQASAYTSSGLNVCNNEQVDSIVGLEFMGENTSLDYDRKIIAQICALQNIGILSIWSIMQEKTKNLKHDIGKSLWSKMRLERNQTINLLQYIDLPIDFEMSDLTFNLNSAKKRMSKKRNERKGSKICRPKSAILNANVKYQDDSLNVASKKKFVENNNTWNNGVVCNHLKIMNLNGVENYLVAKNGGEVLCCRRDVGSIKVKTLCVASAASSVTCIEASPHGLPYFLAATDCGTINMCSLLDHRVLLTLDCRNGPTTVSEKCQSDHKGRYLGSVAVKNHDVENVTDCKLPITTVTWLHTNPFCMMATLATSTVVWQLTFSDMRAKCRSDGVACAANVRSLALLTKEGDVQVFKLTDSKENCLELFEKYIALL